MPKVTSAIAEKPLPTKLDPARLITIDQLAKWWGISRKHVWDLSTRKGEKRLPSYKIGRRRMFIYDECFWYLKKQEA